MPPQTGKSPITFDMLSDVVGLQEIAVLLDVDSRTPHAWQYRTLLPVPDYESINGLRAWDRSTIVQWAAETGRLPEFLGDEAEELGVEVSDRRGGRAAAAKAREAAVAS